MANQISPEQVRRHLDAMKGKVNLWSGIPGGQCMVIFASVNALLGGPTYAAPGAKDLWQNPALTGFYEMIPATETPRPLDIAIWGSTWGDGWGHIAVNLEDLGNGNLWAFGQNPGPAVTSTLSKAGLLGYLRPRTLTTTPVLPAFTEMDIDMATPQDVAEALLNHTITVNGKDARVLDWFVGLVKDGQKALKRDEILTSFDGTKQSAGIILANAGADVRAIKDKTDKL